MHFERRNPNYKRNIREAVGKNYDDDDVAIDFDDDISDFEDEEEEETYIPSVTKKSTNTESDGIKTLLIKIEKRLANIEDVLRSQNSQSVTVTTQTQPSNINESLVNGNIMSALYPPKSVVPEGSMLGEIQTVLAQQASMRGDNSQTAGANDVSGVCTLPNSAYDDEVPNIEI